MQCANTMFSACALHAGYLRLQTHTNSGCAILTAFPLQQRLHESASMLRHTYIAGLVINVHLILTLKFRKVTNICLR